MQDMAALDPLIAADQQLAELERAAYFGTLYACALCFYRYTPMHRFCAADEFRGLGHADAVRTYCDKVSQGLASGGRGR